MFAGGRVYRLPVLQWTPQSKCAVWKECYEVRERVLRHAGVYVLHHLIKLSVPLWCLPSTERERLRRVSEAVFSFPTTVIHWNPLLNPPLPFTLILNLSVQWYYHKNSLYHEHFWTYMDKVIKHCHGNHKAQIWAEYCKNII